MIENLAERGKGFRESGPVRGHRHLQSLEFPFDFDEFGPRCVVKEQSIESIELRKDGFRYGDRACVSQRFVSHGICELP